MAHKLLELKTGTLLKNKQEWIRNEILKKINQGVYVEKLPSLRELSKEYDANVITIQKSLHPLINEGLLKIKKCKGIYIEGKKQLCIGIVGKAGKEYFFADNNYGGAVFSHIFKHILEKGDYFAFHQKTNQANYGHLFRNNSGTNGLIIFAPDIDEKKELEFIRLPYIVIGSTFKNSDINYVDSDNESDSEKAVEKLINEGCKKIVFLYGGNNKNITMALRLQGYKKALKKHGISYDPNLVLNFTMERENTNEMVQYLFKNSLAYPHAIFGASFDATKIFLENLPLTILKNIGLVVYDDHKKELRSLGISYYIVSQPLEKIGKTAIAGLYKLMEGNTKEKIQVCLESDLVKINF
ncbi:MAG: substrate-binding domain-containing protein [Candidatus Omnitrophica bacterium]|nr:substrate-binding domain-containing protein [Candidatus Omnitrophota bacterium]